jgi:hypothetical protein
MCSLARNAMIRIAANLGRRLCVGLSAIDAALLSRVAVNRARHRLARASSFARLGGGGGGRGMCGGGGEGGGGGGGGEVDGWPLSVLLVPSPRPN